MITGLMAILTVPAVALVPAPSPQPAAVEWSRRITTRINDWSQGVSADGLGNVYMAGRYSQNPDPAEVTQVYVTRYTEAGTQRWIRQLNTPQFDITADVAADALGNVFFVGETSGSLGGPFGGSNDAYVGKYDADGNLVWIRQFAGAGFEAANAVATDGLGNAYVTGLEPRTLTGPEAHQLDAFVRKYDTSGSLVWSQLIDSSYRREGRGISVDSLGNVFVSGILLANPPGPNGATPDAFVSKFDQNGTLQWTRDFGTLGHDSADEVAADGLGNVYFVGVTYSDFLGPNPIGGGMMGKYDTDGNLQWIQRVGTSQQNWASGISADPAGNIYVSGTTEGRLDDDAIGFGGIYLSKVDPAGEILWTTQMGSYYDQGWAMSADGKGAIYVSGLGTSNSSDSVLFKLVDPDFIVPEPVSGAMLIGLLGWAAALIRSRERREPRI
jgi:hypothetical protein